MLAGAAMLLIRVNQLHAEGKLGVMPTVGYSAPNQSHFTSRHYWEVGATQPDLLTGWLGRYLDAVGTAENPLQGFCLDDALAKGPQGRGDRPQRRRAIALGDRLGGPHGTRPVQPTKVPHAAGRCARGVQLSEHL